MAYSTINNLDLWTYLQKFSWPVDNGGKSSVAAVSQKSPPNNDCISRVANNIIAQDKFSNNLTLAVRDERQQAAKMGSRQQKKFGDTLAKEKATAKETIKILKNELCSKRIAEMEEVADKLAKGRTKWQTFLEELVDQVNSANAKFMLEKHRSCTLVEQEFNRSTKQESTLRDQIIELEGLNFDLAKVTKTSKRRGNSTVVDSSSRRSLPQRD